MNISNLMHIIIAITLQAIVGIISGDWLAGGLFASGLYFGREHAQREYKIGDPSKLKGYEALDFFNWSTDAKLDLLGPVISTSIITFIIYTLK